MPRKSITLTFEDRLIYTPAEVATTLGVSEDDIMSLIRSGLIRAKRIGPGPRFIRILRSELDRLRAEGVPAVPLLESPSVGRLMGVSDEHVSHAIDPRITFFAKDSYSDRELAYFFDLPLSEIRRVFGRRRLLLGVHKRDIWSLIEAGIAASREGFEQEPLKKRRWRQPVLPAIRAEVIRRDQQRCRYCGQKVSGRALNIDHVVPCSQGGDSLPSNLVVACILCNSIKGPNLPHEVGLVLLPIGSTTRTRPIPPDKIPDSYECLVLSH